ncbi:hypothetical protein TcBrA4_0135940 [Trypanosoma cruzi]|nr:hypothetical protein TcBrA4_0135940 [Trypanosoma cruzi]
MGLCGSRGRVPDDMASVFATELKKWGRATPFHVECCFRSPNNRAHFRRPGKRKRHARGVSGAFRGFLVLNSPPLRFRGLGAGPSDSNKREEITGDCPRKSLPSLSDYDRALREDSSVAEHQIVALNTRVRFPVFPHFFGVFPRGETASYYARWAAPQASRKESQAVLRLFSPVVFCPAGFLLSSLFLMQTCPGNRRGFRFSGPIPSY